MDKKSEPTIDTEYKVNHRNIKYPRLEFKTGTLQLILPKGYSKEKELVEKHKQWIQTKKLTIQRALEESNAKQINLRKNEKELRRLVRFLVAKYQNELGTQINKIMFRKMKTKWASHSQNNNLTINTLLKYLPKSLIEYVIYHEVVHARHGRKHDSGFWRLTDKKFKDHQAKESELLTYWFLIQRKTTGG
jgi:predicted metal-dependent hydrolase